MEITQIVALGIVAAVLSITLRKHSPEFAMMVGLAASVLILLVLLPRLNELVQTLQRLSGLVETKSGFVSIMLKIIGIAYIAEFGAQACQDAGESALASKIELGGKVLIMTASAPILMSLIDLILSLLPT